MVLDNIKLQTTWNDAAGSINSNFVKIQMAIASLEEGSGGLNEEELLAFLVRNGYITTDDLSDYYTKYEVNELIDEIKAGDIDLANYYTKEEIDAKGYLTSDSLVGYAKTTEVAETYATKIALSAVDGRLVSLESYFATSEDADTQINKWNEIVAFLNATEGTTLAGILATYYTKNEIDGKITTIDNSITALDDKYAPVKTWYDALASLIVKDGNNVRIKTNLIVEGDTASGGEGGGSSVGIQGIKLNGTTYRDENSDGIIDLGTIGGGTITEITYEMIVEALGYTPVNSASLGSLATKDSVAWSEITNVLTGGDEFNIIPSGHNGVFSFNHRAKDGGSGTITEYRMRNGGGSYAPVRAFSFIAHGGTSSQFLKADGSLDSTSYLPLSGGTIYGTDNQPLTIKGVAEDAYIGFKRGNDSILGAIGINVNLGPVYWDNTNRVNHTLLHSGNVGEYKSGDSDMVDGNHLMTEVTDWNAYQTSIFKSSQMNTANAPTIDFCYGLQMRFHRSVTNFYTDLVTAIYKDELYYRRHTENGFGSWKQIAFTDSNVAGANKIVDSSGNAKVYINDYNYVIANGFLLSQDVIERITANGTLHIQYNSKGNTIINANGGNVLIGTSTDNGANLQVDGYGSMSYLYFPESDGTLTSYVGRGTSNSDIYLYSKAALKMYAGSRAAMTINSSGNVLIGTTADSGSKLFVNGVTRASAFRSTNIGIECDANGNTSGHASEINRFGASLYLQSREGNLYLSHSAGTTFILGLASITGAVTMASTLSVTGAMGAANIYATGAICINRNVSTGAIIDSATTALKIEAYSDRIGLRTYSTNGISTGDILSLYPDRSVTFGGTTTINGNLVVQGDISA